MSIKVKNLEAVTGQLRKFGKEGKRVVVNELDEAGTNIERNAINAAPAFLAGDSKAVLNIKQRIDKVVTKGGLNVKVGVQGKQDLDAYIEFGTGLNFIDIVNRDPTNYTKEIRDLARTFYKNGEGTLKGTPYLFPSFFDESPKLIARLKKELEILAERS
ncbi:MAG: hypothetical protein ACRCU2_00485 [Planktothrix sp.]